MVETPGSDGHGEHRLVIKALSPGAAPVPSTEELQTIVDGARKHALGYSKALPNFVCVEVTNRSVDLSGKGTWRQRDSLTELLRYQDDQETRSTLEVNGQRSSVKRDDLNSSWPISVGEFGGILNLVFQSKSKGEFQWKSAGTIDNGAAHILTYRVARENACLRRSPARMSEL